MDVRHNFMRIGFGQGLYVQEDDAVERLAAHASELKCASAFIFTEGPGWSALDGRLAAALDKAGVSYEIHFQGDDEYPSFEKNETLANDGRAAHADLIIGAGGGRALDGSKMLADTLCKKLLLAPTSAAQCAAFAPLAAVYKSNGARDGNIFIKIPILGTYVDMRVMRAAPPRLLASGIADALTKFVEPYSAVMYGGEATAQWDASLALAGQTMRILLEKSEAALNGDPAALNDAVYASICLTGLLSSHGGGRPGPSLAHNVNEAAHDLYTDAPRRFLHGEIVGVGVLLNAYACDMPGLPAETLRAFLADVLHTPTTWEGLGYDTSERAFDQLYEFILPKHRPLPADQAEKVRVALRKIWR
jgi:glycerol dehydrogenase